MIFTRKLNLDDIKPLVDELKQYLNFEISDRINSDTLYYNRTLMDLKERIKDLEKEKYGVKEFKYIETGLNIDQALDRLSKGMALRNSVLRDDVYIVAKFESHVKSNVVGYYVVSLVTNKIESDFYMIPKGKYGCLTDGWSVIEL